MKTIDLEYGLSITFKEETTWLERQIVLRALKRGAWDGYIYDNGVRQEIIPEVLEFTTLESCLLVMLKSKLVKGMEV